MGVPPMGSGTPGPNTQATRPTSPTARSRERERKVDRSLPRAGSRSPRTQLRPIIRSTVPAQKGTSHRTRISPMPPPDSELGQWFATHVQPHEAMLRAWLSGRFGRRLDVDDLMQEAHVRVLQARTDGERHAPETFLFAAARLRKLPGPQPSRRGQTFRSPRRDVEAPKSTCSPTRPPRKSPVAAPTLIFCARPTTVRSSPVRPDSSPFPSSPHASQ